MLWKKVFRVIEAYLIRNGIANTMWCLSQRRDEKPYSGRHDAHLGEIFHALARQKECQILEGHLMLIMFMCVLRFPQSMRLLL